MSNILRCQHTQPCVCSYAVAQQMLAGQFALLLHPNEPTRPSNTAQLIKQCLPESGWYVWQRKQPPEELLSLLKNNKFRPWLLFPTDDRAELIARQQQWSKAPAGIIDLFILPDGTWKEVRKMIRQSPWLQDVPLLSFTPKQKTRYTLRRNPDDNHLCTAEIACELLQLTNQEGLAQAVDLHLNRFLKQYHHWQHHLELPF